MRRSELHALTVDDIALSDGYARVNRSKTGKVRLAPISNRAAAALAAWLVERERLTVDNPTPAVWITQRKPSRPLTALGLKTAVRRLAARADLAWSSHDCRRYFAVTWLANNGSEVGLMAAAGWSSTQMVARYSRGRRQELALAEAHRILNGGG